MVGRAAALAQILQAPHPARLDTDPDGVEHGSMSEAHPVVPSRTMLLVALAAAPALVLLARMPTDEPRSSCGMIRPWNESLAAQMLVWAALFIAYKAIRGAWTLRFEERA